MSKSKKKEEAKEVDDGKETGSIMYEKVTANNEKLRGENGRLRERDSDIRSVAFRTAEAKAGWELSKQDTNEQKKAYDALCVELLEEVLTATVSAPLFEQDADEADTEVEVNKDAWRETSIGELKISDSAKLKLRDRNPPIETLGCISDYTQNPSSKLTDIPGIGLATAEAIQNALANWFADNPDKHDRDNKDVKEDTDTDTNTVVEEGDDEAD